MYSVEKRRSLLLKKKTCMAESWEGPAKAKGDHGAVYEHSWEDPEEAAPQPIPT